MDTGTIGEYYVLCELWRNGYNAMKSENPREVDWDLIVLSENYSETIAKLQVKTIDWNTDASSKVITGNFNGNFDFLILVLLNFLDESYTLFVIPKSKIKLRPTTQKRGLLDDAGNLLYTNRTITCTKIECYTNELSLYKDNWSQLSQSVTQIKNY